jgi:hypothetical protein
MAAACNGHSSGLRRCDSAVVDLLEHPRTSALSLWNCISSTSHASVNGYRATAPQVCRTLPPDRPTAGPLI